MPEFLFLAAWHGLLGVSSSTRDWTYTPWRRSTSGVPKHWTSMEFPTVSYNIGYQFSSVVQLCLTLCNPMDCSIPSFLVHHQRLVQAQTHVHWVGDAIQPSHPLLSPSPPAFNLSQHLGLFKWVSSSHQLAKILKLRLQHQSFVFFSSLWKFSSNLFFPQT